MSSVLSLDLSHNPPSRDQKERVVELCKEHFGGAWNQIHTIDQINRSVTPIVGGTSNVLFRCKLPTEFSPLGKEPTCLLLRFYGVAKGDNSHILKDSLVFALLAERGIGPKFYGCFTEGRFEEYIPTRSLAREELKIPDKQKLVAKHMASFHRMDMPLPREPSMLKDLMYRWYNTYSRGAIEIKKKDPVNWMELQSMKIEEEIPKLLQVLADADSPVMFCHNDFQEGNLLLSPDHEDLVVIDYEYSGYNYRGFEFANHFNEWCYGYVLGEPPFYTVNHEDYPTENEQRAFFHEYLRCKGNIVDSEDEVQKEVQKLLFEAEVFNLASHFLWGLWGFMGAVDSQVEFGYILYGTERLRAYQRDKKNLKNKYPERYADF